MLDLVIIGGSAAGTAATVYAARRGLNVKLISGDFGGEVVRGGDYDNYPGIVHTTGIELGKNFLEHVKANGVEPELGVWVSSIEQKERSFIVHAKKGSDEVTYEAKAVILATGVHPRELGVPGEQELKGRGVTYCTTCDGPLFRNKTVVTIGGGNSALESALMLAEIASQVTVLNLNASFNGEQVLIDKVTQHPKITVIYQAQTSRIEGSTVVERVVYTDLTTKQERSVETQGVFVHIGLIPNSAFTPEAIKKNNFGEIEISQLCETTVPGIFAAGDVTNIPYKQAVIAAGQGAIAALAAVDYLNKS